MKVKAKLHVAHYVYIKYFCNKNINLDANNIYF